MTDADRYDRQISLFGAQGQTLIQATRVAIVGLGGLGCHFAQQLAYLGVTRFTLIDGGQVKRTNLNRLVTATSENVGHYKTDVAERLIRVTQPDANVINIPHHLAHSDAIAALRNVDLILGGLDKDAPRLQLTDLASKGQIVYIDAATDTDDSHGSLVYGGRVVVGGVGPGCLFCLNLLDQREIRNAAMTPDQRAADAATYGVPAISLDATGPSVVTINGVVASLAATEAMALLTGLRAPNKQLTYRADQGGVRISVDGARASCPYCARWCTR
jgi:molybdopterin/thiamine biosynthesis adenylyltransferase